MNKQIKYLLLGQIATYCEQVKTGTKLCAHIMVMNDYTSTVANEIKKAKCKNIIIDEGGEYKNIFIYKYDYVEKIIYGLIERSKKPKPDAFEVWSTGKLFGYSDYEISKYLKKHGYS